MSPTQWAGWVGALTGIACLIWNIHVKLSTGPKLRILALANHVTMPGIAFSALSLSALVFSHLIYCSLAPTLPPLWWLVYLVSAIIVLYTVVDAILRCTYRYAEKPYKALKFATFIDD